MSNYTFPNQRVISIHRESARSDFLGIKNENWQAAARDLGAHALMLYLYLASNANGYNLALSPAAICQAIGMPKSTYRDQFEKLLSRGYLIQTKGNSFDFYEKPQPRHATQQSCENSITANVQSFNEQARGDIQGTSVVQEKASSITEINNTQISTNKSGINNGGFLCDNNTISKPKEVIIRIPTPVREGKKEIVRIPKSTEYIF